MGIEFNITDAVAVGRVDNSEAAAVVADVDAPSDCIVSNIVGVIGKFYALDALKGRTIKNVAGATFSVRDVDFIELRNKAHPLRLLQSTDTLQMLAGV